MVTILIMGFASVSAHVLIGTRVLAASAAQLLTQKVDITVYLTPTSNTAAAEGVATKIKTIPGVASATVESAEEVYAAFQQRYAQESDTVKALKAINVNPFGPVVRVRGNAISDYPTIYAGLSDPAFAPEGVIQRTSFDNNADLLNRFSSMERTIRWSVEGVLAFFLLLSLVVVYNTIRMAIFSQRDEIGIMKLVGASNWFIRLPFLLEAILYSVIAIVVSFGVWMALLKWADPFIVQLMTTSEASILGYYQQNFLVLVTIQVAALALASMASAGLAVGRYLKV